MSTAVLSAVSDGMVAAGLNYQFREWKGPLKYPYFVGDYQESEPQNEDGMQEVTFTLEGFTREGYQDLEAAKEKIERYFDPIAGRRTITPNGVVVIFYAYSLANIPTGDAELKKIQIILTIKEWKGN